MRPEIPAQGRLFGDVATPDVPRWFPWNGSKRRILKDLLQVFSRWDGSGRYIDPFVGGGSVAIGAKLAFESSSQVLGDANPWLVSVYEYMATEPNYQVPDNYLDVDHWRGLSDADLASLSAEQRANRFAICLLTAWGNRWETRPDGTFRSTVNTKYCEPDYLARRLREFFAPRWFSGATVRCANWMDVACLARPGDLVYCDPPYPETLGYGNHGWMLRDLLDVMDWAVEAAESGVAVVVSNVLDADRLFLRYGFSVVELAGPKPTKTRRQRGEMIAYGGGCFDEP